MVVGFTALNTYGSEPITSNVASLNPARLIFSLKGKWHAIFKEMNTKVLLGMK
jgi:hypothetical protein